MTLTAVEDPPDALTVFSFEEIVNEITLKRETARQGIESWEKLHAVALELAGSSGDETNWLDPSRIWRIERLSIYNYRGVLNEDLLVLVFDPTPGITVLHGLNGAGKSSISDAVDLALSGKTPTVTGGQLGKLPFGIPYIWRGDRPRHVSKLPSPLEEMA